MSAGQQIFDWKIWLELRTVARGSLRQTRPGRNPSEFAVEEPGPPALDIDRDIEGHHSTLNMVPIVVLEPGPWIKVEATTLWPGKKETDPLKK